MRHNNRNNNSNNNSEDEQYYKIKFGSYSFLASIERESTATVQIRIGGVQRKCIRISIHESGYANVIGFEHNSACCLKPLQLDKGKGSRALLGAAIMFLAEKYPHANALDLMDTSSFECKTLKVNLAAHNMLLYGQTWYERVLGAQYLLPKGSSQITVPIMRKAGEFRLTGKSFTDFYARLEVAVAHAKSKKWTQDNKARIEKVFTKAATLRDFASSIQRLRTQDSCLFFSGYLRFLFTYAGNNISTDDWVIPNVKKCARNILKTWGMEYSSRVTKKTKNIDRFMNYPRGEADDGDGNKEEIGNCLGNYADPVFRKWHL